MPEISLFDAIDAQRAIRRFRPDPVPQEVIERILNAAIRAPSGSNSQLWSFVIVKDQEIKERIAEWYLDVWKNVYTKGPIRSSGTVASSAEYLSYHLAETPVLIFPCYRGTPGMLSPAQAGSIFPAAQNLMLAALGLGLGTVITTFHLHHEEKVKALLGIPDDVQTSCLIPMGYPAEGEHFGGSKRKPIEELTHYDRWGQMSPD